MTYVSQSRRRELARQGRMGCPLELKYPLDTRAHLKNAISRYDQRRTQKCKGFWNRVCRNASRLGVATPKVGQKCSLGGEAFELLSKKVFVIDANCSYKGEQAGADRFDFCELKFRQSKGKHGTVVDLPGGAHVSTIFVGTYPKKAFERTMGKNVKVVMNVS